MKERLLSLISKGLPTLKEPMPKGDMPGDKITYTDDAFDKAAILFTELVNHVEFDAQNRFVISMSGGSGSGKTTLASILASYFNEAGVSAYILSGDNYPNRIPEYNDAERVHRYREAGQQALVKAGLYSNAVKEELTSIYENFEDGNLSRLALSEWYPVYHEAGKAALTNYLGTNEELNFDAINRVIREIKAGNDLIWLKRMGRTPDALWYDEVDFSQIKVVIVEWTHGNHANLEGIDYRIFLNSTPQETLAYRQLRARDGQADSAFVTMVLEIEQGKLHEQAINADLIFAKSGEILDYSEYVKLIEGGK